MKRGVIFAILQLSPFRRDALGEERAYLARVHTTRDDVLRLWSLSCSFTFQKLKGIDGGGSRRY